MAVIITSLGFNGEAQTVHAPSGASLKTTLTLGAEPECFGCTVAYLTGEVTPGYAYKIVSTTNASKPMAEWDQETGAFIVTSNIVRFALHFDPTGNKFYRLAELQPVVSVAIDSASPLAGLVQISTTSQTHNVALAVYDIKCQNGLGALQMLTVTLKVTGTTNTSAFIAGLNLKAQAMTYGANTIYVSTNLDGSQSVKATFANLNINLQSDVWMPVTLFANIGIDTDNAFDGCTVTATFETGGDSNGAMNNPYVVSSSYQTVAVNTNTFTASPITFSGAGAFLSNLSATLGSAITGTVNGQPATVGYNVSYSFRVAAGQQTLFMSTDPSIALTTATTGNALLALPINGVVVSPGNLAGDQDTTAANGHYVIPANENRFFTFQGTITSGGGSPSLKTASIVGIHYGTSTTNLVDHTINYGLQPLKVAATF